MTPILQVKGVTKRYGGLTANNDISFDVAPHDAALRAGTVHRGQVDAEVTGKLADRRC